MRDTMTSIPQGLKWISAITCCRSFGAKESISDLRSSRTRGRSRLSSSLGVVLLFVRFSVAIWCTPKPEQWPSQAAGVTAKTRSKPRLIVSYSRAVFFCLFRSAQPAKVGLHSGGTVITPSLRRRVLAQQEGEECLVHPHPLAAVVIDEALLPELIHEVAHA